MWNSHKVLAWWMSRCLIAGIIVTPFVAIGVRLTGAWSDSKTEKRALIEVNRSIEFGGVDLLSTIDCHFPITNNSRRPLVIRNARAQCQCQDVFHQQPDGKRDRVQNVIIAPGTSALFGIVFVATGRLGEPAQFDLRLFTDNHDDPEIKVSLNYTPTARLYCVPQTVVFGDIGVAQRVTTSLAVYADGRQSVIDWSSITANNPRYGIAFRKTASEPIEKLEGSVASKIGQLEVSFLGGDQPENIDDDLVIVSEGKQCFHVRVQGRIVPGIVVSPAKVSLPRQSTKGPTYIADVAIRTHPHMPFELQVVCRVPGIYFKIGQQGLQTVHILSIEYRDIPPTVEKTVAALELTAICPDGKRHCTLDVEVFPDKDRQ